jgi:hypothetical protein
MRLCYFIEHEDADSASVAASLDAPENSGAISMLIRASQWQIRLSRDARE